MNIEIKALKGVIFIFSFLLFGICSAIHSNLKATAFKKSKLLGDPPPEKWFKNRIYEFDFWDYMNTLSEKKHDLYLKKLHKKSSILFFLRIIFLMGFVVFCFQYFKDQ